MILVIIRVEVPAPSSGDVERWRHAAAHVQDKAVGVLVNNGFTVAHAAVEER